MVTEPKKRDRESTQPADELPIARWAEDRGIDLLQRLAVDLGPRRLAMAGSGATGEPLVSNGHLGADLIRLAAGEGFAPHTHPGDHLLIVIGGSGTITYDGCIYPTSAGEIYMIAGSVPHAVGAVTDHVLLAVGAPHRPVDASDRMTPVEYRAVTASLGDLRCLICGVNAVFPLRPHDLNCPHCPCSECTMANAAADGRAQGGAT
jgi:quercetin dioxygenase-like cupin family protein